MKTFLKKNIAALSYTGILAGCLLYWELVLRILTGGLPGLRHVCFLLFIPAEAFFLSLFTGWGKEKRVGNRITLLVISFILLFFYITQTVYFRNFGSLFSVSMMGMGGDAIGNFWWALQDTLLHAIGYILILFVPFVVLVVLFIFKKLPSIHSSIGYHALNLVLVAALWACAVFSLPLFGTGRQSAYYAYHSSLSDTDTTADRLGVLTTFAVESSSYFLGIRHDVDTKLGSVDTTSLQLEEEDEKKEILPQVLEGIDFNALSAFATNDDERSLCEFYAGKQPTKTNEYTGYFKDYNLIYICAEAFWEYAINEKVTPTLYEMANHGFVFNNYYNSFKNTTTNGEYAFALSLWPDMSRIADTGRDVGSFPQSASKFMPFGIGTTFGDLGYSARGYHNYYGEYYRRILSWPNMGLNCKFNGNGMSFTSLWPASDVELMEQSIPDYVGDEKFLAYYMTFSGHGPYTNANYMYNKNIAEVKSLLGEEASSYDDQALGYLAGQLEFDKALRLLLDSLEEAGKLDNTVIVIAGDHYPYNISDAGRDSLAGHPVDPVFERFHSSCILYNAGMEESVLCDTYCCNVDIYPTILNLFGIPYDSRLLAGKDIFAPGIHEAMLYNQSFITDTVRYNNDTGEIVWTDKASAYTQEKLDNYLNTLIALNSAEYAANLKLINNNFYFFVWKHSGFLTEEQISAEEARETNVLSEAASLRQIDEEKAAAEAAAAAEAEQKRIEEAIANGEAYYDEAGTLIWVNPPEGTEVSPEAPVDPAVAPVTDPAAVPAPDTGTVPAPDAVPEATPPANPEQSSDTQATTP